MHVLCEIKVKSPESSKSLCGSLNLSIQHKKTKHMYCETQGKGPESSNNCGSVNLSKRLFTMT